MVHLVRSAWGRSESRKCTPLNAGRARYDKKLPHSAPPSDFKANLKRIGTFSTVEGFWRCATARKLPHVRQRASLTPVCRHYVYLKRPSSLPRDVNVSVFREELLPMWEVRLESVLPRVTTADAKHLRLRHSRMAAAGSSRSATATASRPSCGRTCSSRPSARRSRSRLSSAW